MKREPAHLCFWLMLMMLSCGLMLDGCGNQRREILTAPHLNGIEVEGSPAKADKAQQGEKSWNSITPSKGSKAEQTSDPTPAPTPEPSPSVPVKNSIKVKGIYVSAYLMKGEPYNKLVRLVERTDLNAIVIDVKNDYGQVTYPSSVQTVKAIHSDVRNIIPDLPDKLKQLKRKKIYTIARIVVFKDPYLAAQNPSYAVQRKSGGIWLDNKGISWVDPFQEKVWNYNLAIAGEAVKLGFDEIQFDYVRFPDNGKRVDQEATFHNPNGYTKEEAIGRFLSQARKRLPGTLLSVDVFGLTTSSKDDMGIGQRWESIVPKVDVISPMVYPSHYSKGMYGIASPDMRPYDIVSKAIKDAVARNAAIQSGETGRTPARVRPWLQDFTAKWVKPHQTYGNKQVQDQIKAAAEKGVDEFLLWNPTGRYSYR